MASQLFRLGEIELLHDVCLELNELIQPQVKEIY